MRIPKAPEGWSWQINNQYNVPHLTLLELVHTTNGTVAFSEFLDLVQKYWWHSYRKSAKAAVRLAKDLNNQEKQKFQGVYT